MGERKGRRKGEKVKGERWRRRTRWEGREREKLKFQSKILLVLVGSYTLIRLNQFNNKVLFLLIFQVIT